MRPPSRLVRLRAALTGRGLDALVVGSSAGMRYLTGFTGSHGLLIVRGDAAELLTDARYAVQAGQEMQEGARCVIVAGSLPEAAGNLRLLRGCARSGFEDEEISLRDHRALKKAFPRIRFRGIGGLLQGLSAVKDSGEIGAIAEAAGISDRVFADILPLVRPGVTELDLAAEIAYRHRKYGAEGDAFEPIVAAGERSAMPHAKASRARIRMGDLVVLDFGCTVRGYHSDLTRTVAVGRVPARLKRIHRIVRDAQEEALGVVREGAAAADVDAAARRVIRREGFGRYFPHSLGHGLGLQVHERPRLAPLSADVLTDGNVITVEPGIYLPGTGGVRIEDDVVVRGGTCEVLTISPKELILL